MTPPPRRGTSDKREQLTRFLARLDDLDQGNVTCSTADAREWRERLVRKIALLQKAGVEPLTDGLSESRRGAGHKGEAA